VRRSLSSLTAGAFRLQSFAVMAILNPPAGGCGGGTPNSPVTDVDQGYTSDKPAAAAREHGMSLEVVRPPGAKRGFVLLPRRWVVERSFARATRFRRLVRDHERLPETVRGLHSVAFACLMLHHAAPALATVPDSL
jgi:transposase